MRPRCKSACLVLALLVSVGFCALASDKPKIQGPLTQTKVAEYLIGPDDILAVQVWKEPEISRNVLVRPDGNISLPLIGDVRAGGRTPVQLQDDIKQQLRNYLASPEVVVIVQEAKSRKFNILGQVERPGSYPMSRSMTVLDAIAVAGGFRDFAKEGKIYILRVKANGSFLRLPFNYKEVIRGQRLSQNVELEPRDTVIVP
ncbi:MAG TPA: polysaccharide biosynthesis/export family protein [Candidatus Saccharimonadales bacterium]|nr:polysaccharide biosynthesis/export family protein [Candidatus Saccharimonadales bacterium]